MIKFSQSVHASGSVSRNQIQFANGFMVSIVAGTGVYCTMRRAPSSVRMMNDVYHDGEFHAVEVAIIDPSGRFFKTAQWHLNDDDVIGYVDADKLVDIMAYVKALPKEYQTALVNEQNAIFERRKAELENDKE